MAESVNDKPGRRPQRFGRFEVIAHIASGGMGAVYKARDPEDNRIVALKVMSPELAAKRNMTARFRREAMSASKLRHDNIVAIHEFGEANGTYYLALEFIDGRDLHDYIHRSPGNRLDPEKARQFTLQAARALQHIFEAGIIHRDVKPSNFLVIERPGIPLVKLTDLGLARHEDDDEHRVTKIGTTLGTVDYMAPEQARDSTSADIRSDLYSLGCTLHHMLTGRPPFPKGSLAEKIVQHMEAEPPDVCRQNADVPPALGLILKKLLAKKPRERYQTPAELIEDLEDPERVFAPKEPVPEKRQRKPVERSPEPKQRPPEPAKPASKELPARKKRKKSKPTPWLPFAIGGGFLTATLVVVLIIINSRPAPPVEKKPELVTTGPRVEPVVAPPPVQQIVGPPTPVLRPLYQSVLPMERDALVKEFIGPFTEFPTPPADAKVIVVCRLPSPGVVSATSLAEAMTQTQPGATSVIEIRDQGPHFLTRLPPLSDRHIWIRGGAGIRPLLAWDGSGGSELFVLRSGGLILENLDVVAHGQPEASRLFEVYGGDFQARACTFSTTGSPKGGTIVARLQGPEPAGAEVKARFSRCLVRGKDVSLVATHAIAAEILVEGTLVVGGGEPLIQHANREDDALTVRLVRSTLAAQGPLWRWRNSANQGATPRLKVLLWDSLLARTEVGADDGPMFHLADGARSNLMSVKPLNCLYIGWRNLLVAGDQTCANLDAWRRAWGHREGDLAQPETWPPRPLGALDDVAPAFLAPDDTTAAYAATGGPGPLGCDIARLPPDPPLWKQRTFERFLAAHAHPPEAEAPDVSVVADGLYHGEKIELGKIDLGQHIQVKLQTQRPGPRIVLHLTGKGTHATSPLRFRGVDQVILHFEQPVFLGKDKIEPLALELKGGSAAAAAALIDVEGGSLEIHKGRFRFENSRLANLPPHMLRVRGGDLRLNRCTLIGPLSKAPDSFQSLISCEGAGAGAAAPTQVALSDCVLQCGKPLFDLKNPGCRLRCRGSWLYALGDVLTLDVPSLDTSRPEINALFEYNTIAVRQAFINLRNSEAPPNCHPIVVQTSANYFLDPGNDDPRQACLLRVPADSLARGLVLWQGMDNVFARDRFLAYYTSADRPGAKQSFEDWGKLWGPLGELKHEHIDPVAGKAFLPDQPAPERCVLPTTLRREPMPGADLMRLGVLKKKN